MGIEIASPKTKSGYFLGKIWEVVGGGLGTVTQDDYPNLRTSALVPGWLRITNPADWEQELLLIPTSITGSSSAYAYLTQQPTTATATDLDMDRLSQAARAGDEHHFIALVNSIDWSRRTPEDFLFVIQYALNLGTHSVARQLAEQSKSQYPDHAELQKYAQLLATTKVAHSSRPANPNAKADIDWLKIHGDEFRGQWVALRGGTLLAAAPTSRDLLASLENLKDKSILITLVY